MTLVVATRSRRVRLRALYRGCPTTCAPASTGATWRAASSATASPTAAAGGRGGDAFHVRGGHLADVLADAELIELTRAEEYRRKAEHLARAVAMAS